MAYNKTKHLNAAQKYLQQGKMPQAILEYQQILKNEPKDQVTLMTLGDLFVRQGETFQALEYFERLAKIFLNDGFTTKAIAIYKKVAKLAPEESRPLERLAELYVQQGVLSEARPLFLQLAEMQLKAGRQPQAALLLRKLLEAEPDNLRVQIRLAELHLSMGQQKEAIETFHGAMQRIMEQGDYAEAIRMADRILQLNPSHQATFILKVRALTASGKGAEAGKLLDSLPNRDEGGETTSMLLEMYMSGGQIVKAADLAEKVFARDPKQYPVVLKIAGALLETGELDRAQALIGLIRNTMMDSGDQEALAKILSRLIDFKPGQIEPLEWLVDLYGRASDSFRLPDSLAQLAYAYETSGDDAQALATYEKLLERTPEDETTRRKYASLRAKMGREPISGDIAPPVKLIPQEDAPRTSPAPVSTEPALEEETQRYVTQALTDVDLFSSYGLTQKAIDLLEAVLTRAPRHTPVLERLLDLSVGAGNDRRTVELASLLEQYATERNDRAASERYGELRRRFQRAAGLSVADEQPKPAPPASIPPPEFTVPVIQAELDEPVEVAASESAPAETAPAEPAGIPMPVESVVHEVDLSDEWAALSQQIEMAMKEEATSASEEVVLAEDSAPVSDPVSAPDVPENVQPEPAAEAPAFDLELQSAIPVGAPGSTQAADALMADLAEDLESLTSSLGMPEAPAHAAMQSSAASSRTANASSSRSHSGNGAPPTQIPVPMSGPLGDLFEEFRSELGESSSQGEDLETHYNLGIAYREMGLLEESISEFQKVASATDKGSAFRYAMQCSTLLGLAFMEKGQPAIAAIWYERALKTPGLDQESVLALQYDLGVAQELAGDTHAAFTSFSQVYAMNIDYRDVSERIALLGKAR